MFAQFDVALTREDYVRGLAVVSHELGRSDPSRDRRIWEQVGAMTLLLLALLVVFRDAGLAVFVTLAAEAFVVAGLAQRWMRRSLGLSYDPATAHFTSRFGDHGVQEQVAGRTRHWSWNAVRQVHDTGKDIVFQFDGWDMLILPYRLWNDQLGRDAFLREARERLPAGALKGQKEQRPISPLHRDQLVIGAVAAAVDTLFLIVFLLPTSVIEAGVPTVLTAFAVGLGAAYFAYRLARSALPQLYGRFPRPALLVTHVLTWAVPVYMLAGFLGWI
jgi:hypothetical protein